MFITFCDWLSTEWPGFYARLEQGFPLFTVARQHCIRVIPCHIITKKCSLQMTFSTFTESALLLEWGCKNHKNCIFLAHCLHYTLSRLLFCTSCRSHIGLLLKVDKMLFSHSDRVVLFSLSHDVTFDLQFLTKCNLCHWKTYMFGWCSKISSMDSHEISCNNSMNGHKLQNR